MIPTGHLLISCEIKGGVGAWAGGWGVRTRSKQGQASILVLHTHRRPGIRFLGISEGY